MQHMPMCVRVCVCACVRACVRVSYRRGNAVADWQAVGAVVVFKLRALIPPAAMLSALAGVSISFIAVRDTARLRRPRTVRSAQSEAKAPVPDLGGIPWQLNFSFTIFANPAVGIVPMMVLLVSYALSLRPPALARATYQYPGVAPGYLG